MADGVARLTHWLPIALRGDIVNESKRVLMMTGGVLKEVQFVPVKHTTSRNRRDSLFQLPTQDPMMHWKEETMQEESVH